MFMGWAKPRTTINSRNSKSKTQLMQTAQEQEQPVIETTDIITYAGGVSGSGYELVCQALENKKSEKALIALATPGGDPHAGFRIARALQHTYGSFGALVPRYCKSAGTLIVVGASRLYLDDMSELGPLDIQVKKNDEIVGRNSGLDIIQAVNYLQNQAMYAFSQYVTELTSNAGLSTKVASEISSTLTIGLFEPIAGQIDPMKLAEMQRAMEIALEYGRRLAEKSGNLRATGLHNLVSAYPSHGFVIDRKEAKNLFINVERPTGMLANLSKMLHSALTPKINFSTPEVNLFTYPLVLTGDNHEGTPNPAATNGSNENGEPAIQGSGKSDSAQNHGITPATGEQAGEHQRTD
jgi:hypothetical protein